MFAKKVIEAGGDLKPLLVDASLTGGTGLCNPSIFADGDKLLVNIRHVGYTLFHSEKKIFTHPWGPCQYVHPENDVVLRTTNYMGELDNDLNIKYYSKVDTSLLDVKPIWEFVGLEDARVVRWNDKLYLCGVRRDTTTNGEGRMELSEIQHTGTEFKEISRYRIPAPGPNNSYCEKNWMPVLDTPYRYVKWCNPTEVVDVDFENKITKTSFTGPGFVPMEFDCRGGSQVLKYKGYYFALVHQCHLYKSEVGRKDARYRHLFVVWDKDWNVVRYGNPFSFLEGEIEFVSGATFWKNDLLITFGFQDNSAFILRVPQSMVEESILKI
jgi:hypothetical protein